MQSARSSAACLFPSVVAIGWSFFPNARKPLAILSVAFSSERWESTLSWVLMATIRDLDLKSVRSVDILVLVVIAAPKLDDRFGTAIAQEKVLIHFKSILIGRK